MSYTTPAAMRIWLESLVEDLASELGTEPAATVKIQQACDGASGVMDGYIGSTLSPSGTQRYAVPVTGSVALGILEPHARFLAAAQLLSSRTIEDAGLNQHIAETWIWIKAIGAGTLGLVGAEPPVVEVVVDYYPDGYYKSQANVFGGDTGSQF